MLPEDIHDGDYFKSGSSYRNGADVKVKSVYISKCGPKMVDFDYVLNGEVVLNTHAGILWFTNNLINEKNFKRV